MVDDYDVQGHRRIFAATSALIDVFDRKCEDC